MSDERVRAAEAEWLRTGTVDAGARWLVERVRAGLTRRLHLEWLAFFGDAASAAALTLLEPRGRRSAKPSARERLDARESSLDPVARAESAKSGLFWYSLVAEDREAAMRALLAALELSQAPADVVAKLANVIVERREPPPDEWLYDAMTRAEREVGRTAVTHAVHEALRGWWLEREDIASRLSSVP